MHIRRSSTAVALAAALAVSGAGASSAAPSAPAPPLGALGSLGSLDVAGSLDSLVPDESEVPTMESISNFRDLVGDGYIGEHGPLNTGVFFRSNAPLHTSEADLAALSELGVTRSYDMRAQDEVDNEFVGGLPTLPDETEYVHVPIDFADIVQMALEIESPQEARDHMVSTNRGFVTDAATRTQFAAVLTGLAENDGPQLFHCTSGKDRAGWVSYLLLSIAGVDEETIMEDYLLSNDNLEQDNERTMQLIAGALSPEAAENLYPLLIVEPEYIQAGIDQLTGDYGDVESYLTDGLGLSAQTIDTLRDKLVG